MFVYVQDWVYNFWEIQSRNVLPGSFFCPTLQQIGEAWCFSGLFSWDLCPVCRAIMTEGSDWPLGDRDAMSTRAYQFNVDVLCESLLQKRVLRVAGVASQRWFLMDGVYSELCHEVSSVGSLSQTKQQNSSKASDCACVEYAAGFWSFNTFCGVLFSDKGWMPQKVVENVLIVLIWGIGLLVSSRRGKNEITEIRADKKPTGLQYTCCFFLFLYKEAKPAMGLAD